MNPSPADMNRQIDDVLARYANMVERICYLYLGNSPDIDDVYQDVFLKLLQRREPFNDDEHEKAWMIRITVNRCKDILRSFWRRKVEPVENLETPFRDPAEYELMQAVRALPQKYKEVIYLHYFEGYSVPEMADMLSCKENTLYSHLHRARDLIRKKLGGMENDYTF